MSNLSLIEGAIPFAAPLVVSGIIWLFRRYKVPKSAPLALLVVCGVVMQWLASLQGAELSPAQGVALGAIGSFAYEGQKQLRAAFGAIRNGVPQPRVGEGPR